jgi:ProP effector
MSYRFNREESEDVVHQLAETYPKCFSVDPRMRRPLKANILSDLQKDGFRAAYELLSAGLDWYVNHFAYQHALETGARRIDLNGKAVGTVTEMEHLAALKKIKDDKARAAEKNLNATQTVTALHNNGRLADDQLKKLDAPPMPTPKAKPAPAIAISPELARLQEALNAANVAATGPGDAELRAAIGTAALTFIVKEAQHLIDIANGERAA